MRKPSKGLLDDSVKIDLTPLIDCVFLLIVFFIVAGKFKKVESRLDAYLPPLGLDVTIKPPPPDRFFIAVMCLGDKDKIEWRVNNHVADTKSEVVAKLREISESVSDKKDIKVSIDGNADIYFYWVIAALDACAEAQLYEIILTPPRVPLSKWPDPKPRNINLGL